MNVSVEISYYPLNQVFIKPIGAFIDRLHNYPELVIRTNGMSTQVFGPYDRVMSAITEEIKKSFELPNSVFVLKIVNADLQNIPV